MLLVTTTAPDEATAKAIAATLVEKRLAACVQVAGPIASTYRWQGAVECATEWLCTAKTTPERWETLQRTVQEMHPYDTPEIIATPITHASAAYAEWVKQETSEP